jgi:hypothetical protein
MYSKMDTFDQDYDLYRVDNALKDFYVDAVIDASKTADISEDTIQNWIGKN